MSTRGYTLLVRLAMALALAHAAPSLAQQSTRGNFDHLRTGFPLTGAHAATPCESCHVRGQFAGTPKDCAYCHRAGSGIAASVMPIRHIPTVERCDNCHRSAISWTLVHFSHVSVAPGTCFSCHNGVTASGKPANHLVTNQPCDACHRTTAWVPAGFNHAGVVPGTCATCHNGTAATGKPSNHIATTASCDTCHTTAAWLPARFDHSGVAPGSCNSCHNGTTATGQPSGHMATTRSCDACHHSTTVWLPVSYAHLSTAWKQHNASVTCYSCHSTKTESATWTYAAYKPNCAGCHAGQYSPDPHVKTTSPTTIRYTVSELQDCSGACHIYTDSTFTVIQTPRSGHHHSTDGSFN